MLHRPLESGLKLIKSCESTLRIGDGVVTAWLTKEDHFGDDTFALGIVHSGSRNRNATKSHILIQKPQEVRGFNSENRDVTQISEHEVEKVKPLRYSEDA